MVLLGQNVNSYYYDSDQEQQSAAAQLRAYVKEGGEGERELPQLQRREPNLANGFTQKWKARGKVAAAAAAESVVDFAELLYRVRNLRSEQVLWFIRHRQLLPSSIISYNNTSISHKHHTQTRTHTHIDLPSFKHENFIA